MSSCDFVGKTIAPRYVQSLEQIERTLPDAPAIGWTGPNL